MLLCVAGLLGSGEVTVVVMKRLVVMADIQVEWKDKEVVVCELKSPLSCVLAASIVLKVVRSEGVSVVVSAVTLFIADGGWVGGGGWVVSALVVSLLSVTGDILLGFGTISSLTSVTFPNAAVTLLLVSSDSVALTVGESGGDGCSVSVIISLPGTSDVASGRPETLEPTLKSGKSAELTRSGLVVATWLSAGRRLVSS